VPLKAEVITSAGSYLVVQVYYRVSFLQGNTQKEKLTHSFNPEKFLRNREILAKKLFGKVGLLFKNI